MATKRSATSKRGLGCDIDAPSMRPLLSLPLSMACDDSDGCVKMKAMMNLKGYEKGKIIYTLAWQRIAFAAMTGASSDDSSSPVSATPEEGVPKALNMSFGVENCARRMLENKG
ncbi:hypothetical protein Tco_0120900 [Tanacetum coccineum]